MFSVLVGRQSGDFLYATLNQQLAVTTQFVAGHGLDAIRSAIAEFLRKSNKAKNLAFVGNSILIHSTACALKEGLHILDATTSLDGIPTEKSISNSSLLNNINFVLAKKIHESVRVLLFRRLDDASADICVLEEILEKKHQLRPLLLMGIYFEGLLCYQYAKSRQNEREKWLRIGELVSTRIKGWNEGCKWNYENKMFLLQAEKMSILGSPDEAELLYSRAIRSAKEHKFIHEVSSIAF